MCVCDCFRFCPYVHVTKTKYSRMATLDIMNSNMADEKVYGEESMNPPPYENDPKEALLTKQHGSTKWQDLWATILFILHLVLFIGLFIFFVRHASFTSTKTGSPISDQERNAILTSLGVSLAASFALTVIYTILMLKFPKAMIIGSLVATIIIWLGLGVYFLLRGIIAAGIIFVIMGLLEIFVVYLWRHRISFSALLLETTVSVISDYPNTITASVVQYLTQLVYFALWIITMDGLYTYTHKESMPSLFNGITIYLFFSLFWTTQVLTNVMHVTVAGVFATFYFIVGSNQIAQNPTLSSFRRAITWSFGSVVFGSLIVAIIQLLRFLFQSIRGNNNNLIASCIDCIMQCLEQLVAYFNYYAYIQVAIYGKPFMRAARDTWSLIQRAAGEVLINDNLIGNVLGISGLVCAGICALLSYICCDSMLPSGTGDETISNIIIVSCIMGAIIGWATMALIGAVIQSGASTTIVCYCEDPEALNRSKPDLYQRFVRADAQPFP